MTARLAAKMLLISFRFCNVKHSLDSGAALKYLVSRLCLGNRAARWNAASKPDIAADG
jgi:hypothetical protein